MDVVKIFIEERHKLIVDMVNENKSVSVKQLADAFDVSLATIRKDLTTLDEAGNLHRTHGGAVAIEQDENQFEELSSYEVRKRYNKQQKLAIAKEALKHINPDEAIILDASSTSYELAKLLVKEDKRLIILTNGIRTADILKENLNLTVIIVGGIVNGESNAIKGLLGEEIIDKINFDKIFFSSSGLTLDDYFTDFNLQEIQIKQKMISTAQHRFALVDSSKFDKESNTSLYDGEDLTMLITDSDISDDVLEKYEDIFPIKVAE